MVQQANRTGRYSPLKRGAIDLTPFTQVSDDAQLMWLEKGGQKGGATTHEQIEDALDEYSRLFKAGIASNAEKLTLARAFPDTPAYVNAVSDIDPDTVMVVGGPASVEMVDREGHLITTNALSKAFDKYMENFRTRNAMVLHSDVQVGWALPAYITKGGQIFKSGINGKELFFITELRDDTKIADRVSKQIDDGKLRSYSIAGSATKVQNMQKGLMPYMQVDDMELAEVTVCEKGVNQGAAFQILKAQTGKIDKDQCGYRPATDVEIQNGIMCGTCKFFSKEDKTCDAVDGLFEDTDYCKLFDQHDEQEQGTGPTKIKVKLILSEDGKDISFNKTLQELVQNPEWSTTMSGMQTQRDWWDWDLPEFKKSIKRRPGESLEDALIRIHQAKQPPQQAPAQQPSEDEEWAKQPGRWLHPETGERMVSLRRNDGEVEHMPESYMPGKTKFKPWTEELPYSSYEEGSHMDPNSPNFKPPRSHPDFVEPESNMEKFMKALKPLDFTQPSTKNTVPSKRGRSVAGMQGDANPAMGNPEMELMEKGWGPFKSREEKDEAASKKLWEHPAMQEFYGMVQKYPKAFNQDHEDEDANFNNYMRYQNDPEKFHANYIQTHHPELLEGQGDETMTKSNSYVKKLLKGYETLKKAPYGEDNMYNLDAGGGSNQKIGGTKFNDPSSMKNQAAIRAKGAQTTQGNIDQYAGGTAQNPATMASAHAKRQAAAKAASANRGIATPQGPWGEPDPTAMTSSARMAAANAKRQQSMGTNTSQKVDAVETFQADPSSNRETPQAEIATPAAAKANPFQWGDNPGQSFTQERLDAMRPEARQAAMAMINRYQQYGGAGAGAIQNMSLQKVDPREMMGQAANKARGVARGAFGVARDAIGRTKPGIAIRGAKEAVQRGRQAMPRMAPSQRGEMSGPRPRSAGPQPWSGSRMTSLNMRARGAGPTRPSPRSVIGQGSKNRMQDSRVNRAVQNLRNPNRFRNTGGSAMEGMGIYNMVDEITANVLKAEGFTTLANEEARQQEHDQLLREYGFPSEMEPEAGRYVPVIETETNDKGIPINNKGPWVVNEAGQDAGEINDEDAPNYKASEKAKNTAGEHNKELKKSWNTRMNPPVLPFLTKRSL